MNIDTKQLKEQMKDLDSIKNSYSTNALNSFFKEGTSESGDFNIDNYQNSGFFKSWAKSQKNTAESDTTMGVKTLLSTVLEPPGPKTIGRSMVRITETVDQSVIIRLPKLAVAGKTARELKGLSTGERNVPLTLTPNLEIEASDEYDDNYLEDSPWNVAQREAAAVSRAHDILETQTIIDFYDKLAIAKLATGAVLKPKTQNEFSWDDIVNMWESLGDFNGNILAVGKDAYAQLLKQQDFKDTTIFGSAVDFANGIIGTNLAGFVIMWSTAIPTKKVYAIDTEQAGQYVIRRNKILKTFRPAHNKEQVFVSTRFDLKLGRDASIARMDWSLTP